MNSATLDKIGFWAVQAVVVLAFIPVLLESVMRSWTYLVESYWKMKVKIEDAPAKARRELEEETKS